MLYGLLIPLKTEAALKEFMLAMNDEAISNELQNLNLPIQLIRPLGFANNRHSIKYLFFFFGKIW